MKRGISPRGPGKPGAVPSPGGASRVGPSGAAPSPRLKKNSRDYGKLEPAPPQISPNPFGPSAGNSRLGGI